MSHIMLDLETLGTTPGSIILAIGACYFSPVDGLGREFYRVISRESCEKAGLVSEPATVDWWSKQSPEARRVLELTESPQAYVLDHALRDFTSFVGKEGSPDDTRIWGNGADFDNALIMYAYKTVGLPVPWKFWNNRCYRTMKSFAPNVPAPPRRGTHHNGLDDAKTQAEHAVKIMQALMSPSDRKKLIAAEVR